MAELFHILTAAAFISTDLLSQGKKIIGISTLKIIMATIATGALDASSNTGNSMLFNDGV